MKTPIKYLLFALAFGLFACEQVIELELDGTENPLPIVQAEVIDYPSYSYVLLSYSQDFYTPENPQGISNAEVTLRDDQGLNLRFVESTDSAGYYLPENPDFVGEVGRTYSLEIRNGNETYTSTCKMPPVTAIVDIKQEFQPESIFREEGYYLYFSATEPPETKDFYRWKVYENDTLYNEPQDILLGDDEFVVDRIEDLELPYAFEAGDTVRLEMYGIDGDVFRFYNDMLNVIFNDGGLFSPPPYNPKGNVEGALGVFSAASMEYATVVIEE
jgi:hypothetical protein